MLTPKQYIFTIVLSAMLLVAVYGWLGLWRV